MVTQGDDLVMYEFNRSDIHAARWLADQQQGRGALDFAGDDDFLLVAPAEILGRQPRVWWADVEFFHLAGGVLAQGRVVHQ